MVFNPTEVTDRSWMRAYAQAPSVIIEPHRVRIFFATRGLPDPNGQYLSHLGFIDVRRDNLFDILRVAQAPVLPLGALGTFDQFGTNPASVIKSEEGLRVYYDQPGRWRVVRQDRLRAGARVHSG
jgi:hypothetical protein